jgi:hypothetical protein
MTSHTPGKLRLGKPFNGFIWSEDPTRGDPGGANWPIAEIRTVRNRQILSDEDKANAERLVHCWNWHDALLTALKKGRALAQRESMSRASGELGEPYLTSLVKEMDAIIADAERADTPAVLFVCGGVYGEPPDEKFAFVSPFGKGDLPYVAERPEALALFRLCAHHSSLYQISPDFTQVYLEALGDASRSYPEQVNLTPEQQTILREAAKKPWMKSS